jgi:selenocysteine lyase/cysteine desulfurase
MWAADTLFACRQEAAALFGVDNPERVTFTANATHALGIAIGSAARTPGRVLVSGYEHNAVMRPLEALKEKGFTVEILSAPLFEPEITLHRFEEALGDGGGVSFVVCTHVSNVFGFILPAERIARLCHAAGVAFVLDAAQSAGCLPIDAAALPGVYIAMPGHKGLYGPQGTGLLISPANALPEPLLRGGTGSRSADAAMPDFLPDRLEAGTHNLPGVAGLLEGLRYLRRRGVDSVLRHERALTESLLRTLSRRPRLRVYHADHLFCQTGVLAFTVEGMDAECIAEQLAQKGVAVRAGLHCAPAAHRTAQTFPGGAVRVSFSAFNTPRDVDAFLRALEGLL